MDTVAYLRVMGDEIRTLRKKRGLTRKELNSRLRSDVVIQTLAAYELGSRQPGILRFVEICLVLDEWPDELMRRVHERVFADSSRGQVRINLRHVVRDDHPALFPLRRWAQTKLDHHPAGHTAAAADVLLGYAALNRMAELCDLDITTLIGLLREISGPVLVPLYPQDGGEDS